MIIECRQIIHSESSTGSLKALSAVARMKSINSTVACRALTCKLTADNAESIIAQYDLVVDATDNIESRYLINDCCVLLNKPLISGSAVSMDGQITVIVPYLSPCYRCIYPDVPSAQGIDRSPLRDLITHCNIYGTSLCYLMKIYLIITQLLHSYHFLYIIIQQVGAVVALMWVYWVPCPA